MLTALTKMAGGALLLLAAILLVVPRAEAQPSGKFSGTAVANEIDVDDDELTGGTATAEGGGPFGKSLTQSHQELAAWDGTTFCDDTSVELVYTSWAGARTYTNGDQLYLSLAEGILCANIIDGVSFTFELKTNVTGGTGKFEGATGSVTLFGSGRTLQRDDPVPGRPAFSAFTGTTIEEIVLAH